MSTFKIGERVRVVRPFDDFKVGQIVTIRGFECDDDVAYVAVDGSGAVWDLNRFEKVEPEFVVGQQVSGDDYKRLPVGSKIEDSTGAATKVDENTWRWDDGEEDANEDVRMGRTLTHLGDGTHAEPEDKADLYVEPEPLKEGDWVQVWAKVHDPSPRDDELVELRVRIRGGGMATAYTTNDAIVRPDAGQVPPWITAEQDEAKAISAIKTALVVDGGMHDDRYTQQTAESLYRAGIRATKGGAS